MFICLDIETTGLNPKDDHVIEVAIVRFDHEKIIEEWSSLVKPPIQIPEFSKRLTGIDDEMVADAPTLDGLKEIIIEKVGADPIMGHFIFFDVNFLNKHGFDLENQQLDTCQLMQVLLPNEPSYSLEVLTKKLDITQEDAHRALDDVKANIELFWKMRDHIRALNEDSKQIAATILEKSDWPWAQHILPHTKESGGTLLTPSLREKNITTESHCDLSKATQDLETPFLFEESSFTTLDLIEYSTQLDDQTLLVVPDLSLLPEHDHLASFKGPHEYIDESRLERYLDKERLSTLETSFGLKIKLWLKETETGEKSELRIIKEENTAWYDVCCEAYGEGSSYYKKAKEAAFEKEVIAISHHHFLRDSSRKDPMIQLPKNVVVGEVENFISVIENAWHIFLSESRFLQDLNHLKEENPDAKEVLDHIAAKVSILFGFIGMVIQQHGEPNDPRHTLVVEAHHRNTLEWNKVTQSTESINAAVAALGGQIKTGPLLDELQRHLHYLEKIFKADGPVLWLTLSGDQHPIIHAFPENTSELFSERVWKDIEHLHLFSHHSDLGDDFEFIKSQLGLNDTVTTKSSDEIQAIPMLEPETNISSPNDPKNIKQVVHEISRHLSGIEGNVFLLVTSKHSAEQFFYTMKQLVEDNGRKLFVQNLGGGMGKLLQMSKETDGHNLYVGDEGFMNFLLDDGVALNFLFMHRLPFSYPNSPIQKSRTKGLSNAYTEFSRPQASLNHQRIINKFLGNAWEGKQIMVLDPRKLD